MAGCALTNNLRHVRTAVLGVAVVAACTGGGVPGALNVRSQATVSATLRDVGGRELGTLTLTDSQRGINLTGRLRGVAPGEHGLHIHSVGRCEPTFDAAGGHWNPTGRQHGIQNAQGSHFGDLPNITVGADSTATVDVNSRSGTLRGSNSLFDEDGAAVVLHAGPDDYRTDPSGGSGARIACGVVNAN